MAKGYWIVRLEVSEPERYKDYVALTNAALEKFGGRFLVRGGPFERLEGEARSRNVVVEFADYETALACWHSPDYQAAYAIRAPISSGEHVVVEGYDGPQAADTPPSGPGTAYWVMRIDVHDPETYKSYIEADAIASAIYRPWFLVRGGRHIAVQGVGRARNVLVAFPDYETALACYNSPEYQRALGFRLKAADAEVLVIHGVQ